MFLSDVSPPPPFPFPLPLVLLYSNYYSPYQQP